MAGALVSTAKLRFCDTDRFGHINNSVYSVLYEAGRVDLMQAVGLLGSPLVVVIVRLEIDFLREMNWPGEVDIETSVARIGGKSIHLRQRLMLDGETVSRSRSVVAAIDQVTRRAVALGAEWRAAMAPYLVADESSSATDEAVAG